MAARNFPIREGGAAAAGDGGGAGSGAVARNRAGRRRDPPRAAPNHRRPDLLSKWMGECEKLVANLFQMARKNAPSIIFIDEIDSLSGQREEGNESEASWVKTEFLVQMQGVGHNDDKVLVLAAKNTPRALDQAVRRRFDKRIYIPLPDLKARQRMFKVHLGDTPHSQTKSDIDFESLAHRTDGFSGSDMAVCVNDVLFEPVRKAQDAMFIFKSYEDGRRVDVQAEATGRSADHHGGARGGRPGC